MSDITNTLGLENVGTVYHNLDTDTLINRAVENEGAKIASSGALMIDTGIFTGRSPKDKYFVDQPPSNQHIAWGEVNRKIDKKIYDELLATAKEQLNGKRLHIASYTDIVKNYFEIDSEFSKVLENKIVRYEKLVDQFENNTLDIEREKELLNLDIKLDEIAPMMSKSIFLRFKESQDRINDHGES